MVKILVWVLVLNSWDGHVVIYDNLASQDSCERMLSRSKASTFDRRGQLLTGTCTQVEKLVPAVPSISIPPAEITVRPAPVKVIIKEVKK